MLKAYPAQIWELTVVNALHRRVGSHVSCDVVGYFTDWQLLLGAARRVAAKSPGCLGFRVVELPLDEPGPFATLIPESRHRTWLLRPSGEEWHGTPGYRELWEYGTTQVRQGFEVGDWATFIRDRRLQVGIVVGVPRCVSPKCLRQVQPDPFADSGIDVTDEYLWFNVEYFERGKWHDIHLMQTEMFPFAVPAGRTQTRALTKHRDDVREAVRKEETAEVILLRSELETGKTLLQVLAEGRVFLTPENAEALRVMTARHFFRSDFGETIADVMGLSEDEYKLYLQNGDFFGIMCDLVVLHKSKM